MKLLRIFGTKSLSLILKTLEALIFFQIVVDSAKFLKGMRDDYKCFNLIPKYRKEEVEDLPIEAAYMLNEF